MDLVRPGTLRKTKALPLKLRASGDCKGGVDEVPFLTVRDMDKQGLLWKKRGKKNPQKLVFVFFKSPYFNFTVLIRYSAVPFTRLQPRLELPFPGSVGGSDNEGYSTALLHFWPPSLLEGVDFLCSAP